MKYDCDVVRDLLPLYEDDTASKKTRELVSEHLKECSDCREYRENMAGITEFDAKEENTENYAKLAQKLRVRNRIIKISTILMMFVMFFLGYYLYTGLNNYFEKVTLNNLLKEDIKTIKETYEFRDKIDFGNTTLEIYEDDTFFKTIKTESGKETIIKRKKDGKLNFVAICSYETEILCVVDSKDENVSFIGAEFSIDSEVNKEESSLYFITTSQEELLVPGVGTKGINAFSQDGKLLYSSEYIFNNIDNSNIYAKWIKAE